MYNSRAALSLNHLDSDEPNPITHGWVSAWGKTDGFEGKRRANLPCGRRSRYCSYGIFWDCSLTRNIFPPDFISSLLSDTAPPSPLHYFSSDCHHLSSWLLNALLNWSPCSGIALPLHSLTMPLQYFLIQLNAVNPILKTLSMAWIKCLICLAYHTGSPGAGLCFSDPIHLLLPLQQYPTLCSSPNEPSCILPRCHFLCCKSDGAFRVLPEAPTLSHWLWANDNV